MEMISYVLYDPATGELLGGYLQVPPAEHEYRVPATDYERNWWPYYKLNADRTALERWYFEPPEVDPEPEEPVQSEDQSPQP